VILCSSIEKSIEEDTIRKDASERFCRWLEAELAEAGIRTASELPTDM
jgi:hypothetical protein